MPIHNKYDSQGRLYSKENPRPQSQARYIATGNHPYNIGRNAAKRWEKARRAAVLKAARQLH